jgi:hypothetical protein
MADGIKTGIYLLCTLITIFSKIHELLLKTNYDFKNISILHYSILIL